MYVKVAYPTTSYSYSLRLDTSFEPNPCLCMQPLCQILQQGAMADLETAIQQLQEVLDLTLDDHLELACLLHSLEARY